MLQSPVPVVINQQQLLADIETAIRADLVTRGMFFDFAMPWSTKITHSHSGGQVSIDIENTCRTDQFNEFASFAEQVKGKGSFVSEVTGLLRLPSPEHKGRTVGKLTLRARNAADLIAGVNACLSNPKLLLNKDKYLGSSEELKRR